MPNPRAAHPLRSLTLAWLGLVTLTVISLGLGKGFHGVAWLQIVVAAIIWIKGMLVARHFIEAHQAHPFIRRVVYGFVAFTPVALLLTAFYGQQIARWASL